MMVKVGATLFELTSKDEILMQLVPRQNSEFSRDQILEGLTVLLIEDSADLRLLFDRVISAAGGKCVAVSSAKEARDCIDELEPDVIVSDLSMPDEDGLSFMKGLRADPKRPCSRIPAIAVTAFTSLRDEALGAGFNKYVTKPIAASTLVNEIETLV